MFLVKRALSALGKIGIILAIAVAFVVGLTGTIYLSLRSPGVKVPDVVGKDYITGESALNDAGLYIRRRATRASADAQPNIILDQSPRAGEIIKAGQTVAVVVSRT
ncbi:MAG TPA: PASTA domain-containing protein, partial [Pyrinomonadaceae bacterium]|nr:PASTA domain-containing protein [Pyrinomonadaceae bacterium]